MPPALAGPPFKSIRKSPAENAQHIEEEGRQITDWNDLLRDSRQDSTTRSTDSFPQASDPTLETETQNSVPDTSHQHDSPLDQLRKVFQRAYARGDENHPDWDEVAKKIEDLLPKNLAKRRCSGGGSNNDFNAVEAEQLQYHFFQETLHAIKKTSVVAALEATDSFQTKDLIDKTTEESAAWEQAQKNFEEVCKEQSLTFNNETDQIADSEVWPREPFDDYLERLAFHSKRLEIKNHLNSIRDRIIQKIINAKIFDENFKEKCSKPDEINERYQQYLKQIEVARNEANRIMKHKWAQFYQEAATRYIEDATQVEKIQLWKNKNHATSLTKTIEEVLASSADSSHIEAAFQALEAWQKQQRHVEALQESIASQKKILSVSNPIKIEEVLTAARKETESQMKRWTDFIAILSSTQLVSYVKDRLRDASPSLTILQKNVDDAYQNAQQAPEGRRHAAWSEAEKRSSELLKFTGDIKKRLELFESVLSKDQTQEFLESRPSELQQFQSNFSKWEECHQKMSGAILSGFCDDLLWRERQQLDLNRNEVARALGQANASAGGKLEEQLDAWKEVEEHQDNLLKKLNDYKKMLLRDPADYRSIEQELVEQRQKLGETMLRRLNIQQQHVQELMKTAQEQHQLEKVLKQGGNPVLARYNKKKYFKMAADHSTEVIEVISELRKMGVALGETISQFEIKHQEQFQPFIKNPKGSKKHINDILNSSQKESEK